MYVYTLDEEYNGITKTEIYRYFTYNILSILSHYFVQQTDTGLPLQRKIKNHVEMILKFS